MARLFTLVALVAAAATAPLVSACSGSSFSFNGICIPIGGDASCKGTAPPGKSCPDNWFWHIQAECCTPSTPVYSPTPSCNGGQTWDKDDLCCKPSSPSTPPPTGTGTPPGSCQPDEFIWYGLQGKCCLPNGGHPSPPSPPSGSTCPSGGWWWHSGQGCCVPPNPSPPTPSCPGGWPWSSGSQCCSPPPPQPSGGFHWKRNQKKRSAGLCPIGLEACPVGGLFSLEPEYECVDTVHELQSCGGCSSVHPELDCTSIEGSWNVGCEGGSCRVYSCSAGYKLSRDHKSCEKL